MADTPTSTIEVPAKPSLIYCGVGESLIDVSGAEHPDGEEKGENTLAHIDLMIGDKRGPVGIAFATALADQKAGHSNLLAVLEPDWAVKPSTVMITKVTIDGARQAVQMFGPAQYGVAMGVMACLADGTIPNDQADDLVIVCGVFIHWKAKGDWEICEANRRATEASIRRAMKQEPTVAQLLEKMKTAKHPFSGLQAHKKDAA
jgi:5,6,7,8-tetrahydromethanopterin hydro-lyase